MSRPKKQIDDERVQELLSLGMSQKEVAEEVGVSVPTIRDRMKALEGGARAYQTYKVRSLKARLLMELEQDIPIMEPEDKIKALQTLDKMDRTIEDKDRSDLATLLEGSQNLLGPGDSDDSEDIIDLESDMTLVEAIESIVKEDMKKNPSNPWS